MIDPVTAVAMGTGGGAIIGVISNIITGLISGSVEKKKIEVEERLLLSDKTTDHQASYKVDEGTPYEWQFWFIKGKGIKYPKAIDPPYRGDLRMLTYTLCFCTAVCFVLGDLPVASFSPSGQPTETSIGLGLIKHTQADQNVYILTFAGLGTYFISGINFILTAVYTGIVPKRGK